jgi:acyl carrier protein
MKSRKVIAYFAAKLGSLRLHKVLTMSDNTDIKNKIFKAMAALLGNSSAVSDDTPLIGDDRALDSMKLLELCLSLEDLATDLGFEFDWTSETAMSKSRSMFRTAGTLATEFLSQMARKE